MKLRTDLKFNLNHNISKAIGKTLKNNKNSKIYRIFEYTKNDLMEQLKHTIPKGYAWQDYLDGRLQMDHIIPISAFNFTKHEHIDFKRCWALSNLRLVTPKENSIKGAKLNRPFQPALAI
ncbi:hypothetical protein ES708_24115 [subsurface metagenome]